MSDVKNLLLCGVGGQGTILASQILAAALIKDGHDVKMSELHGMAQRGGTVTTQVRYGEKVYAPVIGQGSADILVAFEKMEGMRYLQNLNKETGILVVNDHRIDSSTVMAGLEKYPEHVLEHLKEKAKTYVINATEIAKNLGNPKCMNVVLLGALVKLMGLEHLDWDYALEQIVKPKFIELNTKALEAGMEAVANGHSQF